MHTRIGPAVLRAALFGCTLLALSLQAAPAQQADPQGRRPASTSAQTAAPGRSGGEGGGSATDVTLREATKADPILQTIVGQPRSAPSGNDPASRCLLIAWTDYSLLRDAPTQIVDATVRPATAESPALCVVNGFVAPQVAFRLWLPLEGWNGRFLQNGCGGRCGDLLPLQCEVKSRRGYACLANDLGHKGTTYDNIWAIDDVPAEIDFGFRATHVAAIAGKAITEKFYGSAPRYSYFIGASTGGRQALVAVQRFPLDYNGVIAGESLIAMPGEVRGSPAGAGGVGGGRILFHDGHAVVLPQDIRMLHEQVMRHCDGLDGLVDGIITDPRECSFAPKDLQCRGGKTPACLTSEQVAAVDKVYASGPQKGSELGWIGAFVAADGSAGRYIQRNANPYSYPYSWVFNDNTNPDIRPFQQAGGKFILYSGWADEIVAPLGATNYYETVERVIGSRQKTQEFFRLFMIPGQSHIPGNVGAESLDYLAAMEAWVEQGRAPDVLVGHKLKWITQMMGPVYLEKDLVPSNWLYSRPIYPYPIQARYRGKGNPDDAASFGPWDPVAHRWIKTVGARP